MNNNEEMSFWLFGQAKVSKLAILGGMFFLGWLIGFLMGKPKAKIDQERNFEEEENPTDGLSDEDRDYIR